MLLNFAAMLLLIVGVLMVRARVAAMRAEEELPPIPDWANAPIEVTT